MASVRFNRGSYDSTLAAARRLMAKTGRTEYYIFATAYGYTFTPKPQWVGQKCMRVTLTSEEQSGQWDYSAEKGA